MSIKFKLIVSVALATLIVMLSGGAVMLWNFQEIQQQHISRIQDSVRMLNREFVSVLIETDIEVAADLSARLESLDNVLHLFLRDDDGMLRYSYQRDGVEQILPPETGAEYVNMADNYIEIVRPVVYNGLDFGTVYLRSSMDNIVETRKVFGYFVVIMVLFLIALAIGLSMWLQHFLAMPVIELSRSLGRAGSRHDYSLRLDSDRHDEIGVLFAGFNRLMSRIERSQKDLQDYRYALDQSAMVCVVGISGLIRRVNNRFEMATGYQWADIIDRPITLLNEQLSLDNFNSTVNDSNDGRKYDLGELLCHTPNNDELWLTITCVPLYVEKAVSQYLFICYDISSRKQADQALQDSEWRFRQLAENVREVFWMTRPDRSEIIYVSPAYEQIWGLTQQSLYADPMSFLLSIHPDDYQRVVDALPQQEKGGYDIEYRLIRPDDTLCWVHERAFPVYYDDGSISFVAGIADDITESKNTKVILEQQVETRTNQLLQEKQRAETANRAKSRFLSNMSHELRTPLNAILGFSQLMARDGAAHLDSDQKISVNEIELAGRHLLKLINDILDLAKIESGQVELSYEEVFVTDLLNECQSMIEPMLRQYHLECTTTLDDCEKLHIRADYTRLKQVILNLLSNACKYNQPGGCVDISCTTNTEGRLRISITDEGSGIAPEHYHELFRPFSRLGMEAGVVEGTGIGLVISKQLTEQMGGEIGFSSETKKGSTFWIEFEIASGQSVVKKDKLISRELVDSERLPTDTGIAETMFIKTVVYIEDNPANLRLMERLLNTRKDVRLLSAVEPVAGMAMIESEQPDLVLLDINLPEMNGFEVLARLMENERCAHIPVIAVSANAMPDDISRARQAGFVDYVTKPIDINRFFAVINRNLTSSS